MNPAFCQLADNRHKYGSFIAVPIQRLGEQPVVMWGFSTAAARDAFAEEYPGVQIE